MARSTRTASVFRPPTGDPAVRLRESCVQKAALAPIFDVWFTRRRPTTKAPGKVAEEPPHLTGPTKDTLVLPWQSQLTDIEKAVGQWLKRAHPEIHKELIWRACKIGGLLRHDDNMYPDYPPAPEPTGEGTIE